MEIEEQRQTVERLKETTWGVVLHEGEEGRKFVVLPAGSFLNPPWTVGGRPAASFFLKGVRPLWEGLFLCGACLGAAHLTNAALKRTWGQTSDLHNLSCSR